MWHYGIWIYSPLTSVGVVHSTWPSRTMWHMYAPTFNKWHKKKRKIKKVTLHMLTHGAIRGCGVTSLVVCINDKLCDIRERNVTIRSEICTTNICSLGFRDIKEWVLLWRLILRSLGCTQKPNAFQIRRPKIISTEWQSWSILDLKALSKTLSFLPRLLHAHISIRIQVRKWIAF